MEHGASRPRIARDLLVGLAISVVYIAAGKFSLRLASVHPSATPVWPPTGIAIATLLAFGSRFWPSIFAGAFIVNLTTAGSAATSAGIATGNTLEAVISWYFVTHFANGLQAFERTRDILQFAVYTCALSTPLAATFGVTSLGLGGFAPWSKYSLIWRTWWLGDAAGALIFAPFLLLWFQRPRLKWSRNQLIEAGALLISMVATAGIVFAGLFHVNVKSDPWTFLCTPFLVWAAFRFGQRAASTAICILSGIAVYGTSRGYGPFVGGTPNDSLLLLQSFLAVMALTTLVFAAEVSERQRQEARVRVLAVSDPLTGLANYRLLLERIASEIKRYGRTGRPFSLLLLDLDGLKKINDAWGHLVGSRALCRVAEVLRLHCREIDTPARYGGDEFALVLPETPFDAACQVAHRIARCLEQEAESPRLSVSIGVAEYPEDGSTIEFILSAADQALYEEKRRGAGSPLTANPS